MTVIAAPHDAWASVFCPSCRRIVQFQAEDVTTVYEADNSDSSIARAVTQIICTCGAPLEVGRH
jgi:hypothetical protein